MPNVPVKPIDLFLKDLQANILKFHGRKNAVHVFLTFNGTDIDGTKIALRNIAETEIVSAEKQWSDAKSHDMDSSFDGGPIITFSLSATGYHKLELSAMIPKIQIKDLLDGVEKEDPAFKVGLKSSAAKLSDDISIWDDGFRKTIDALVIVSDDDMDVVAKKTAKILQSLDRFASVAISQNGTILRNENGIGIEHFGYADGVSQPIYLDDEIAAQGHRRQWNDTGDLDNLLVADPGGKDENSFGSFLVFRKLEQNVHEFKKAEDALNAVLDNSGKPNDDLAGAMIVGRFEDGSETVNDSNARGITKQSQLFNDFDYRDDAQALKCPFHAHIRITNPRSDVTNEFAHQVRLTRRAIPYNDIGRNVDDLEGDRPTHGVGLLFQCYQHSITNQFEFIQKVWVNDGDIGGHFVGQDGIIGQGPNILKKTLPFQWNVAGKSNQLSFSGFVKMLGGEYFFTPSISFLKGLS
jgi:Dyp-type peroxidase family